MNVLASRAPLGPFRELLGAATVVGHRPLTVGETFLEHETRHAGFRRLNVDVATGEELLETPPLLRGVRMQRKLRELHVEAITASQSFRTDRTEVAPRSDVIREDLERHAVRHSASCLRWLQGT